MTKSGLHAFVMFILVIVNAVMPLLSPHAAAAQSEPVPCNEIEVVFIVDQSGSMGGVPVDHPIPNDPNGLRFFAPLRAVRWMGQDYAGANGLRLPSRPVITYHVAVVDFGNEARVRLPWTTIAPASDQDWRNLDANLSQDLAPYEESLGNTNILDAMETARDLFDQRTTVRDGCPRRAILVLTDGMPYVKPVEEGAGFSVTEHMGALTDLVENDLARQGVGVWVTAINDSNDNYWTRMEPIWRQMLPPDEATKEPRAWKVNTEDEIGERFANLMVQLANRKIFEVRLGPRCVPPFLQQIVLTFYKRDPSEHLDVSDPVGPLTPSRTDVDVEVIGYDEPIESLIVRRPIPGRWEINTTAPRADVIIDEVTLPAIGQLVRPSGQPSLQFVQDTLALQLVDSQGNTLPTYADPTFSLAVEADVRSSTQLAPLAFADSGQSQLSAPFIPVEAGSHQLVITAKSSTPVKRVPEPAGAACQWETTVVLDQVAVGDFSVAPVKMALVGQPAVVSATAGNCPLQQGDEALVNYRLEREDTQQPIVISLPTTWEAVQKSPSGDRPVSVEGPGAASGVYTATALFDQPGQHNLISVASVRLPDGTLKELLRDQQSFNVAPVQELRAEVLVLEPATKPLWWRLLDTLGLTPDTPGQQIGRTPLWRLLSSELEVLVSLDGQTAADPATALQIAPDQRPVQLVLAHADGTNPQTISLDPTNVPGRYHATVPPLSLGKYELRVAPIAGLTAACGYTLPVAALINFERVDNPIIYAQIIVLLVVILLVLALLYRRHCNRRNACKGYLAIVDKDGKVVDNWYKDLGGRNYWRLTGDKAPPPKCGIQDLRVRSTQRSCGRDPYDNDRIWVQFTPIMLVDVKPAPQERVLTPREVWKPDKLSGYAIKYVIEQKQLHTLTS